MRFPRSPTSEGNDGGGLQTSPIKANISGPAADPDGDGIPNFAEYALGLEPNHPDSGVLQTKLELNQANSGFHGSFTHPTVLSDVEFAWEESTDLIHWQPSQPKRAAPVDEPPAFWTTEYWFFRVDAAEHKFVRLVVKPSAP